MRLSDTHPLRRRGDVGVSNAWLSSSRECDRVEGSEGLMGVGCGCSLDADMLFLGDDDGSSFVLLLPLWPLMIGLRLLESLEDGSSSSSDGYSYSSLSSSS